MKTPTASSATSSQREQTSLLSQMPRSPRSNVCSTPDPENPSASVHPKRFSTPSLTLKFLCAGKLNPRRPIRHLFLFIGADPNTRWLSGSGVALDSKGFVLTGADAGENRRSLETSRRGVYAIGDIRSGSVKRVASAVGEGAQVVAALHAYLSPRQPVPTLA